MSTAVLGEGAIIWQPDDYVFFKKCGEITISPDIQNIGFNCVFCNAICLQTEIFLQHVQEQHKEEIFKLYENQNSTILNCQESQLASNFSAELMMELRSDVNLNENLNNSAITANNSTINSNYLLQNKKIAEVKENCINLNTSTTIGDNLTSMPDVGLVYDIETNDLLALTHSSNQDFENLITLNDCENLINNATMAASKSNNKSTLTSNTTTTAMPPTFVIPSNNVSASSGILKCLPADNECEIDDGEDSGIMLVQSPCHSDCGCLSDCVLFTEDSSSKLTHNSNENVSSSSAEYSNITEAADKASTNTTKGKYVKTPAMRKALNNKELIKYLLDAYRKKEKLWNPKHPFYIYNAHRTIYNELSQPLLNDKNCSLTGEEIFGIITELRARYRRELRKFEVRKGKHKTNLWYFEKMEFLRDIIETKRKEQREKEINDDLKYNKLTNRQIFSFILKLYHQNECLWNPKHKNYGRMCNKTQLHEHIAEEVKTQLNVEMTSTECSDEIQKLRIRYRKELGILMKHKGRYIPKLWCFDEMSFLRPIVEEKITKDLKKTNTGTLSSISQKRYDFQKADEIKFNNLEQQLKFIEIYRNYNSLWDVDHPDYRSTLYRRKALNKMLETINLTFIEENKFKREHLEKTIHILRKNFSNAKLKCLKKMDFTKVPGMSFIVYEKLNEFLGINLGPFRCDICQRICRTYDQFRIHKSKHDNTIPFVCTLCGKGFRNPGNLTVHIRRHRRDFPYSCEVCKKSFATSTEVSIHMRTHTGERPYACKWCDKRFKTWSFYNIHKRIHLNRSNFHCPICDKSFYERNRFTDHMNVHLNIRKYECDHCGKSFTTMGNLRKHLNMHAAVKKHKCQSCCKSFAQFASLRWHRKAQHEQ